MYWNKGPMSILWLDGALVFLLVFFLVAVTSAPPADLSIQHRPLQWKHTLHCLQCWTCDQCNHKVTELDLSKVSHPTDRREECQHIIPLHIFPIVIVAPWLTEAKAHPHIVLTTFYQLAAGRSTLTRDKNWTKEVCFNRKLTKNFINVFKVLFLPVKFSCTHLNLSHCAPTL